MAQKIMIADKSVLLLRKIHVWILVSEKLFKSMRLPMRYSKLYQDIDIKYSETMKLFTPVVGVFKRFQDNEEYLSKLMTLNANIENFVKKTIQNINYNPINSNFNIFFYTAVANSVLLSAEIVAHNAFYKTEYDSICTRLDNLYNVANEVTDKIENRYLSRYGINDTNKVFNNDVRVPIDQCIFGIEDMLNNSGMDIRNNKLYSPHVHQYTHEELVQILKERLHINEHNRLDPEYKVTTTCVLMTKAV